MLHKMDYRCFEKARQVASISDYNKTHVGCVAVYQGQVIGLGCNCNKTHPTQKKYNKYRNLHNAGSEPLPKLHSEMSCINQIKRLDINFSKVKLYIYRIRKDQPFGMARPCSSCMAAIRDLGIRNIYYTTNEGYAHEKIREECSRRCSIKMCQLCRSYPCNCHCPNYKLPKSTLYCSICNQGIYDGEEYIENDNSEYAHWECVDYGRDLAKWLGYEIKTMESNYEKDC